MQIYKLPSEYASTMMKKNLDYSMEKFAQNLNIPNNMADRIVDNMRLQKSTTKINRI